MYKLFSCFRRKLNENELRKIQTERVKILPLYHKIKKKSIN